MDLGSSDSNLRYAIGLSQFKKLVLITMFAVAWPEKIMKEKSYKLQAPSLTGPEIWDSMGLCLLVL